MNDLYSVHNGYYLIWHSKCKRAATLFILAVTAVLVLVLEDGVWIVELFLPLPPFIDIRITIYYSENTGNKKDVGKSDIYSK